MAFSQTIRRRIVLTRQRRYEQPRGSLANRGGGMKRAPLAAKRDSTEPLIVSALQKAGAHVERLDQPFDLLVGFKGKLILIEVKDCEYSARALLEQNPGKALNKTEMQQRAKRQSLHFEGVHVPVVWTPEQALRAIGVNA